LELLGAQGFDLRQAQGLRWIQAEEMDQVISEAVQLQPEGVD